MYVFDLIILKLRLNAEIRINYVLNKVNQMNYEQMM